MPKSCIPGYDEALAEERRLREDIFLGINPRICGIEVQYITPFLLTRLNRMSTPFLTSGKATQSEIVRFLWAISPEFQIGKATWFRKPFAKRDVFIDRVSKSLVGKWDEAEEAIDIFIRDTFIDAASGGADSVPYVTGTASMLYLMGCDPFRWDKQRTLHTPLREIYQLIRCKRLDEGAILYNDISDRVKAKWLDELNARQPEKKGQN